MNHVSHITYQKSKQKQNRLLRVSGYVLRDQKGSSLIEVIISLFMITVLFILYISALNTVAITKKLRYENLAYHVANKQMEDLRGIDFASLPSSGTIIDTQLALIPQGSGTFTVADSGSYSGIKEVTVTVTWNDGVAKQVELKTLAGLGGINP
ncbi:MAG: hypothetical protein Q8P83_03075 [bacterium]|nr:hypothetical protein [bacterium]